MQHQALLCRRRSAQRLSTETLSLSHQVMTTSLYRPAAVQLIHWDTKWWLDTNAVFIRGCASPLPRITKATSKCTERRRQKSSIPDLAGKRDEIRRVLGPS